MRQSTILDFFENDPQYSTSSDDDADSDLAASDRIDSDEVDSDEVDSDEVESEDEADSDGADSDEADSDGAGKLTFSIPFTPCFESSEYPKTSGTLSFPNFLN